MFDFKRPVPVSSRFRAKMYTLNTLRVPVLPGQRFTLHYQCFEIPCNVTKLLRLLDTSTGKLKRKKPRTITKNQLCAVEITTTRPICIESKSNFPQSGIVSCCVIVVLRLSSSGCAEGAEEKEKMTRCTHMAYICIYFFNLKE